MVSKEDRAWTAGIIDGDGCVTLRPGGRWFRNPIVVVDNTDMEILNELISLHGGSLVKKKSKEAHHRQAWSWRLYGPDKVIAFLRLIRPYMRCAVKKERADLIIREYKLLTIRNGQYTVEQKEAKFDFERRFMAIGPGRGSQCKVKSDDS